MANSDRILLTAEHEPPRKSRIVNAIMALATRGAGGGRQTPHMSGASPREKVLFEYDGTAEFIARIQEFAVLDDLLREAVVLDLGCGWGGKTVFYAEHLNVTSIHGLDLPGRWLPHATAFAAERGVSSRCEFSCGRAEDMPFSGESFDVLICEDVLEHVAEPQRVLAEAGRVLRPGGVLIAKFPSFKSLMAHHLDRATSLPGVHLLVSMRTLASGLNWLRVVQPDRHSYEPFRRVIRTPFGEVTSDLNGMGFSDFWRIATAGGWNIDTLCLAPARRFGGRPLVKLIGAPVYRLLWRVPALRETISSFVVMVARKPLASPSGARLDRDNRTRTS